MNIASEISNEFIKMCDKFQDKMSMEEYIYVLGLCVGHLSEKKAPSKWEVIKSFGDGVNDSQ